MIRTVVVARAEFGRELTREEADHVRHAMVHAAHNELAARDQLALIQRRAAAVVDTDEEDGMEPQVDDVVRGENFGMTDAELEASQPRYTAVEGIDLLLENDRWDYPQRGDETSHKAHPMILAAQRKRREVVHLAIMSLDDTLPAHEVSLCITRILEGLGLWTGKEPGA